MRGAPVKGFDAKAKLESCVNLPSDKKESHDLSGLAWDGKYLYAISDWDKEIRVFSPPSNPAEFKFESSILLDSIDGQWAGEALAITKDRFYVIADETRGDVVSVGRPGTKLKRIKLRVFDEFSNKKNREKLDVYDNFGIEGLGYIESDTGSYIFTVNEQAFKSDGNKSTHQDGTIVRILRRRIGGGGGGGDLQVAYKTNKILAKSATPERDDNGVSDLLALSPDRLLLLERAYVEPKNSVLLYLVDLSRAKNIVGVSARAADAVVKHLVLDLADLDSRQCPSDFTGPQRLLENFEGMALGPALDGRQILFLVSDDNGKGKTSTKQTPRLLTISLDRDALWPK